VKLYAGPDVVLHFKYSIFINSIYVCFTYGIAMPVLFPITLFAIFNMYVCERIQFAYFYKRPPLFGNTLNDKGLSVLQFAPFVMMFMSYW